MNSEVILITGGCGFLGQHIIRELQLNDKNVKEIRVLDLKSYNNLLGHKENIPVRCFIGDITNIESCRNVFNGVNCVIHAAAYVSYEYPPDIEKLNNVNIQGTKNIVKLCIDEGIEKLIYIGTAEVAMRLNFFQKTYPIIVGKNEQRAFPITSECQVPYYIRTKLIAERIIIAADKSHIIDNATGEPQNCLRTVVLRPTNMYGELDSTIIPTTMQSASLLSNYLISPTAYGGRQQLTYAGNVGWATILAKDILNDKIKMDQIAGQPMFITDDTTVDHVYVLANKITNIKVSNIWIPIIISYPIAKLLEKFAYYFNYKMSIQPTSVLSYLGGFIAFNRLRASICLEYIPKYTEKQAIEQTKNYFNIVKVHSE